MKKPRFTEQQIPVALRQAEQGTSAGEICRKRGVSEATFYAGTNGTPAWAWPSSGACASSRTKIAG